ncbi:MAG: type II toxin-antitoxin system death-on-curing family toxin [Acidimicrobiales bacterium]
MTVQYLDLTDYLAITAEVTALDADTLTRVANLHLADSALHAPAAGWGGEDFYPDFIDKAAVLMVRLAKNHPLPDGNKRAAWVALRLFVEMNGWSWDNYPSVGEAEDAVVGAASSEWDETRSGGGAPKIAVSTGAPGGAAGRIHTERDADHAWRSGRPRE